IHVGNTRLSGGRSQIVDSHPVGKPRDKAKFPSIKANSIHHRAKKRWRQVEEGRLILRAECLTAAQKEFSCLSLGGLKKELAIRGIYSLVIVKQHALARFAHLQTVSSSGIRRIFRQHIAGTGKIDRGGPFPSFSTQVPCTQGAFESMGIEHGILIISMESGKSR